MSVVHMKFESQYLGSRHPVTIILPDTPRFMKPRDFFESGEKYQVLWLLHGTFGDCDDWLHRSKIEVYACERNLAVVMLNGLNMDYVNWPGAGIGTNMFDYLFEELMPMIYHWYPISDKREDNYIAGLSMGGGGTMVYALSHPEKFAAAASLSYPLIPPDRPLELSGTLADTPPHLFGLRPNRRENQILNAGGYDAYVKSPANTWDRLIECEEQGISLPKLYFCCGTDDPLYPYFQDFQAFVEEKGYEIEFAEEEGASHEWRFWDKYIEIIIKKYVKPAIIPGLPF